MPKKAKIGEVPKKKVEKKALKKSTAPKKRAKKKSDTDNLTWSGFDNHLSEAEAAPYSVSGKFDVGQKLKHKKFGVGYVIRLVPPNKMEVLFEEESRLLVKGEQSITDETFGLQ